MRSCLALTTFLLLGAAAVHGGDASKKDQQPLQGTWKAVKIVVFGEMLPKDVVDEASYRFDGEKWFQQSGKTIDKKGTFQVDSKKQPKTIDLIDEGGEKLLGIYTLEGKTLKICASLPAPGQKRPSEFSSTKQNGCALFVFELSK